jgi:hypothetical protein
MVRIVAHVRKTTDNTASKLDARKINGRKENQRSGFSTVRVL